ncbi:L,D-transpeptidase family protein [Paenibacillus koleovorans]|uniref:L,D-transpeptidase family protein n=1 Tax=Paenibacillus koleovorans TaxID=121608 RepID=UPI000FD83B69|nr:L,D-transpeptidase family protein [Paenibacillus koleovorans]
MNENKVEDRSQLLIVDSADARLARAVLRWYQWDTRIGKWREAGRSAAALGRRGITANKREGDDCTPIGLFSMGEGFGTLPAPMPSRGLPYTVVDEHDYWVDDPESSDYNQWVRCESEPTQRWSSYERLAIEPYAYAAVIRYNEHPIVAGQGSAIFLHVWGGPDSSSAGCVTVPMEVVRELLQWMDPDCRTAIAIGTAQDLKHLVPWYRSESER